jgi:hypothetical protein
MNMSARNSDMMQASAVGSCRASTTVPLIEQHMVVGGELIRITSEEHLTSSSFMAFFRKDLLGEEGGVVGLLS